jgi:subtilisin family serine protease
MSQASYSLVNENNLSLRPAGEWDSELSDTIQFRDRSRGNKLVTPTFAIAQEEVPKSLAQEFPLLQENDLEWSTEVEPLNKNSRITSIGEALVIEPIAPKTTLQNLGNQNDITNLAVNGQDVKPLATNPAFDLIGLNQLRNDSRFQGIDGSDLTVVVIDTGLDGSHPSIRGNFTGFLDIAGNGTFTTDPNRSFDTSSHGTHVAGTVGATDSNVGVAPDVNLISLQVFDRNGDSASNSDIEEALQWVSNNRQRYNIIAVNMSLGGGQFYTSRQQARNDILLDDVGRLEQAGVTVVSAAGNSYASNPQLGVASPGIFSSLVVGGVYRDSDRLYSLSQRLNSSNMIFAPGRRITSTLPGGGLGDKSGTSMASPHIAGSVALMQEAARQFGGRLLSTQEVVGIMRSTADTINDSRTGLNFPRLNIYKAVTEVQRRFSQNGSSPSGVTAGDSDPLTGGTSSNIFVGNANQDTLISGAGSDRFVFQSPDGAIDRINDFSTVSDRIEVSAEGFGGGLEKGVLDASQFRLGARALDASDRFIYNQTNGVLSYDSDGTGALAPTKLAILDSELALSSSNFAVTA